MSGMQAIDSLRHFAGKANELQLLRDRVEELEFLLGISEAETMVFRLDMPLSQATILNMLYRASGRVTRDQIYCALYGARRECDQPESDKIVDVHVSKLRKWLRPREIIIHRGYGRGWWLIEADKEKLRLEIEKLA